jgi:type I restriction enzyme R subunit
VDDAPRGAAVLALDALRPSTFELRLPSNFAPTLILESTTLAQQAANNTKEQFANSPDLQSEIMNAIIDALDAHMAMSAQALNSETVRAGIKDILLNHTRLWETLRSRAGGAAPERAAPEPTPGQRARRLREALVEVVIDAAKAARESREIFAASSDPTHVRWLDLELSGYGRDHDRRPLHEILGLPAGAPLIAEVIAYRTQIGQLWGDSDGGRRLAHFFVEPLAELITARDRVHNANVPGRVELSFAVSRVAPQYPKLADFPADVFDQVLAGFASALWQELEGLAS